jgi:hypothetical protein
MITPAGLRQGISLPIRVLCQIEMSECTANGTAELQAESRAGSNSMRDNGSQS